MLRHAALIALLSVSLPAAFALQAPTDRAIQHIEKEVRHELVMLPLYGVFDNLTYRVDGAKVILAGQVVRPTLKTDAERAVKRIEGVESVDNQIEVLPVSPNDDRIRMSVYREIYGHEILSVYAVRAVPPIHIIVKNGIVTLEGVVASQLEKQVAYTEASMVPGVFSVINNLATER